MLPFALLMLLSITTYANSAPSSKDCQYYYQVENDHKCGETGYPLHFGLRLCKKYLSAEPELSPAIKKWFPKIRLCLQRYLENTRGSIRGCDDLKKKAINSHIPCYVQTGFCSLPQSDLIQIMGVTSYDLLDTDIIGMSFNVMNACRRRVSAE